MVWQKVLVVFVAMGIVFFRSFCAIGQTVEVDIAAAGYDVSAREEALLKFTPTQSRKKDELGWDFIDRQKFWRDKINLQREALKEELASENPDRSRIRSKARLIQLMQAKLTSNRIDYMFKFRSLLSPEQRHKLREVREESRAELKAKAGKRDQFLLEKFKAGAPGSTQD